MNFIYFFGRETVMWMEEEEAVQIRLLESLLAWFDKDESNVLCHRMNVRRTMNGLSLYWRLMFTGRLK
jgi:hypothetical protein